MKQVHGLWLGDERIINGIGRVAPGKLTLPADKAAEFERQGLFRAGKPKVKETDNVRADD